MECSRLENTSSKYDPEPKERDLEEVRSRMGNAVKEAMLEILQYADEIKRKTCTQREMLDKGIWYPKGYIDALKKWGATSRIQWLKEKDKLIKGLAPRAFFTPKHGSSFHFIARPEVKASEAVEAAIKGLGIYDCGMVCQIARYKAMLKILGEDKFNQLFDSKKGAAVNIGYLEDDEKQPMRLFIDFPEAELGKAASEKNDLSILNWGKVDNRPVKVGQLVLFHGVREYKLKHPHGVGGSFNVICVDDTPGKQLYAAFGLGPRGVTEKKIYEVMVASFNQPSFHSEILHKNQLYSLNLIIDHTFENSTKQAKDPSESVVGYDPSSPQDFKIRRIWEIMQTSASEIKPAIEKYYPMWRA